MFAVRANGASLGYRSFGFDTPNYRVGKTAATQPDDEKVYFKHIYYFGSLIGAALLLIIRSDYYREAQAYCIRI